MTALLSDLLRQQLAVWHLDRVGPWRRAHQTRALQLLQPVSKRDVRERAGFQVLEEMTDGSLKTREHHDGRLDLVLTNDFLSLPRETRIAVRNAREVTLHLSCSGGSVRVVHELLELLEGKAVSTRVTYACSAAAVLACAIPGRRVIRKGGHILLHSGVIACVANSQQLERHLRDLRRWEKLDVDLLAKRCRQPRRVVRRWTQPGLDALFSAEAALEARLVDAIVD